MTLTPIHVRGKRKTPRSNPPLALGGRPQHHDDHHDPQQPHQSPARPRKSLSSVVAERPSRRRATLDSLPTEILESILLYCTNLSLPHASPLIALKLSDTVTLLRLFIEAFSATWETWFGVVASRQVLHGPRGPEGRHDFDHGDPVLQVCLLGPRYAHFPSLLVSPAVFSVSSLRSFSSLRSQCACH